MGHEKEEVAQDDLSQEISSGFAEIEMVMRDKDLATLAEKTTAAVESSGAGTIEQILAELNREIELAHANQEKDEVIAALYGFRARLTAILEGEKNRSG